jgi:hypothetical protein
MPSTTPYKLWIRGVNAHLNVDAESEGTTGVVDNFPDEIAEPSVLNGWMKVGFYAADPEYVNEGKKYTAPGGIEYDDPLTFKQWPFVMEWYTFPDDEATREALYEHLRKREVFIVFDTYEASAPQHVTPDSAIYVTRAYESEHKDERGRKRITMTLRKGVPKRG